MRRTTPLTAAALLGLAVLGPATVPAQAVGETCRGEAATIVGTGTSITGTEGRDVIVSGSAGVINALGGDDLICLAGTVSSSNVLSVDAGSGSDLVDTTALAPGYYVTTVLGAGADTFVGGRADDSVYAGEPAALPDGGSGPGADTEVDTIDTGEAGDYVATGSPGTANHDVVRLGPGDDGLSIASPQVAADAVLDGGEGGEEGDTLRLASGDTDIDLDMAAGTFSTSTGSARATSFESVVLTVGTAKVTYRGTAGNDSIYVRPTSGTPTLDIATAAGQDEIVVEPASVAAGSRIDGGEGRNGLTAANAAGSMSLDLEQGSWVVDGRSTAVAGLQDAFLIAADVTMVGNDRGNNLAFAGCRADLTGGDGRDRLSNVYDSYFESYTFDCRARTTMSGGSGADALRGGQGADRLSGGSGADQIEGRGGNDRVRGGDGQDTVDGGEGRDDVRGGAARDVLGGMAGADTLIGGAGRDTADGSTGRDRCDAERERRCER